MSKVKRRSSWVSTDGRRRRRPRLLLTSAVSGAATAVVVGGLLVGVGSTPALALCADGGDCVNTASIESSLQVLPISTGGATDLTVSNDGASGTAKVGVVGYLRGDDPADVSVVDKAPETTASVSVSNGDQKHIRLTGVPADAQAIMLQVGGTDSPTVRSSWRPSGSGSGGDGAGTAQVDLSPNHDRVTRAQLVSAMRDWAHRRSTAMPTDAAITRLVDTVGAASGTPAHLAAAIAPGPGTLKVGWRLQSGAEVVTAVRVTRDGPVTDGSSPLVTDQPATSGSTTLQGLDATRSYTVTVAPVIDGTAGTPITMIAKPLAAGESDASASSTPSATASDTPSATAGSTPSDAASASSPATASASASASATASASASASATADAAPAASADAGSTGIPATPAGWKLLFSQGFDKSAALGSFTQAYPGWSGYDGGTDTSRTAGRPASQQGVWNNGATSSVSNGVYSCHLFTKGSQPQVCALTPTLNGQYWSGQMYGRYSVRFKSDRLPGYKIAWLLWPSSNDWNQGEIDFPEGDLDGTISGSVHNVNGNPGQNAYFVDTKQGMSTWQTATIDWRPGRVTFIVGDQSWTTTDPSGIPTHPMRWALQAETQIAAQAPDAGVAGDLQIDWLAGYSYTG